MRLKVEWTKISDQMIFQQWLNMWWNIGRLVLAEVRYNTKYKLFVGSTSELGHAID